MDIKGADIKAHEQVILESKALNYSYLFAKDIKDADIKAHSELILDSKNLEYNYLFAKDINKSDVRLHTQIILDSKDIKYNYWVIRYIKGADVSPHVDVVLASNEDKYSSWRKGVSIMYPEEKTLAIIKPDGMKNIEKIIEMIYNAGLKIEKYEVRELDEEILKEHYSHIIERPFYPELRDYMLSGKVVIMVLKGIDAVKRFRDLMGPTNSEKAPKGTIRGEFGTDVTHNAVHGSDSKENAEIEINRFFRQKQKRI